MNWSYCHFLALCGLHISEEPLCPGSCVWYWFRAVLQLSVLLYQTHVKVHFCPTAERVWVYVCLLLLCVSVTWFACVPVSLHVRAYVSLYLCVGFLRGGVLPVEWPSAVRVRTGSQHPVLQKKVSRICKVCRAALPPRCQCLLLAHGTAAFTSME